MPCINSCFLRILWLACWVGCTATQLSAQYNTDEKRANFYIEISQKYSPTACAILKSDEKKQFVTYANNAETAEDLLNNYNTVVHETCHGYNFKLGIQSGWGNEGY